MIAIQLLLSVLGAGVGLSFVQPQHGGSPTAGSFGIGAGLWWLLSTIIAFVFGSFVAARMANVPTHFDGALHGLVIWGITLILTFYLLTTAIGGVLGGAFSALGSTVSAAGQGISSAAPQLAQAAGVTPDLLQQQVQAYLQPANPDPATMSAEDAQKEILKALPSLASSGDEAAQARQRIIDISAVQMKVSPEEAGRRFDETQAKFNQTRDQAIQTAKAAADQTAATASRGSFYAFAALLIGAAAACLGGAWANPLRPITFRQRSSR